MRLIDHADLAPGEAAKATMEEDTVQEDEVRPQAALDDTAKGTGGDDKTGPSTAGTSGGITSKKNDKVSLVLSAADA